MRLDFDTRLSLAFVCGLLGLIEQGAIQVLAGIEPSTALTGAFVTLMTATIGVGLLRGARDTPDIELPPRDSDDERTTPQQRWGDRYDHVSKREDRRG